MGNVSRFRLQVIASACALAAVPGLAIAQGFAADYDLVRFSSSEAPTLVRLAPAFSLGGDTSGAGLSLRAGRHWFGQVALDQVPASPLTPAASHDLVNLAGGYRWADGKSLSLQLSRERGTGQRLGLAVNFDWPRYFMRLSYEPGLKLLPQDSLRFSAGVRF